jgi:hypothetical protein
VPDLGSLLSEPSNLLKLAAWNRAVSAFRLTLFTFGSGEPPPFPSEDRRFEEPDNLLCSCNDEIKIKFSCARRSFAAYRPEWFGVRMVTLNEPLGVRLFHQREEGSLRVQYGSQAVMAHDAKLGNRGPEIVPGMSSRAGRKVLRIQSGENIPMVRQSVGEPGLPVGTTGVCANQAA